MAAAEATAAEVSAMRRAASVRLPEGALGSGDGEGVLKGKEDTNALLLLLLRHLPLTFFSLSSTNGRGSCSAEGLSVRGPVGL